MRQQICIMLLLVYYTLNLVVLTRCTKVFDQHNQHAADNPFCTEEAAPSCKAGTHVLCMYDTMRLGPKCLNGEIVPFQLAEIEFIKNIFNEIKRNIAKGAEIIGKDDEHLPRGKHMMLYHWGLYLAQEAQAWANQCNPLEHDLCRNYVEEVDDRGEWIEKDVSKAGQFVTVFRFNYPDWSYPGQDFDDPSSEKGPDPTPAKIRFMIKEITKGIFEARKLVSALNIHNYTREDKMNPYILVAHGPSTKFGCAMTKYLDHVVGEKSDNLYNAVMFVCNFSSQPIHNNEVYYYIRPVESYNKGFKDPSWSTDDCGCRVDVERNVDCLCTDNADPDVPPPHVPVEKCYEEDLKRDALPPAVVLMPIFTAEKADLNKRLQKRVALNEHEQRHGLLNNIRKLVAIARNNYAIDLGLSNAGPLEDIFVQARFKSATINPHPIVNKSNLKFPMNRKRHTVKPRRDFSNMDHLVSEYLAKKRKFNLQMATDAVSYNDMNNNATATITPIGLSSNRDLRYSIQAEHNPGDVQYHKNMSKIFQNNILKSGVIPDTYNNFLRPVKEIQESHLIQNIGASYIDHEQQSISAQGNKFLTRNQTPLHIHAYDRISFYDNKPFENGYRNVKYDNPPDMLINSDYEIISSGDNFRPNRPNVYGTNKIRRIYLESSNYRRILEPHDKKFNNFGRRLRRDSIETRRDQHYFVPDRLSRMRDL